MSAPDKKEHLAPWSSEDKPIKLDMVESENESLFTADPASFFVVENILNRVRDSVSDFRALFADRPELRIILEKTLARMKKGRFIDIDGDRIVVLRQGAFLNMRGADFSLFPKLLGTLAKRVRQNYMDDPKAAFKSSDELFWRALPDHPKVRQRLFQITNRFIAEVDALGEEVKNDPEITADQVRMCTLMTGNLDMEDFK